MGRVLETMSVFVTTLVKATYVRRSNLFGTYLFSSVWFLLLFNADVFVSCIRLLLSKTQIIHEGLEHVKCVTTSLNKDYSGESNLFRSFFCIRTKPYFVKNHVDVV